jgi:hypothetical protein
LIVVFFIFERTKSMLVAKWPPKPSPSHTKVACTCGIQFAKRPKVPSHSALVAYNLLKGQRFDQLLWPHPPPLS